MKIKIGIFGGSGYGGSELLRILLFHPHADVRLVTASDQAGKPIERVHPNLRRLTDLVFTPMPTAETIESAVADLDCLFFALPHGHSMGLVPHVPAHVKVIDLAGDFRISDPHVFQEYYGRPHQSLDHLRQFVYGLTELNRAHVAAAARVANPGCFATAALLGLYPLANDGLVAGKVIVDAKTGSSGSGTKPAENTHHPKRSSSFFAYKPLSHQHLPEICQRLNATRAGERWEERLLLQVHSAPLVRGIFASIYLTTKRPLTDNEVSEIFGRYYADAFFVRLIGPRVSPDISWVKHTNFCDIGWASKGSDLVVFVAIDNLLKGGSGQAVQNMNVMFGLDETTGLKLPGSHP